MKRHVTNLPVSDAALGPGQAPISAVRAGEIILTSGIPGIDMASGHMPTEPEAQFELAFANMRELLSRAGAGIDAIGLVTVWTPDRSGRAFINKPWLAMFPGENRPARKTNHAPLPQGVHVQLTATAILGGERTAIGVPGLKHKDPLPMGARIGRYVFSSVFAPEDPRDGKVVEGPLEQLARAFDNGALFMEQAGGIEDNINHYWVYMQDFSHQPAMVEEWVRRWAIFGDRPARKTVPYELPAGSEIQLQLTGVLGERRKNYEVPGVGHHDPIPMASSIGPLLQSSGIYGIDAATGKVVEGRDSQTDMVLRITRDLMAEAGGAVDDITALTVMVQDFAEVPYFRSRLKSLFPDPNSQPALHFIRYQMPKQWHLQFHVTAMLG